MFCLFVFFFQAEDGIRDLVRSRGLGDVYKRQGRCGRMTDRVPGTPGDYGSSAFNLLKQQLISASARLDRQVQQLTPVSYTHLTLPTIYSV